MLELRDLALAAPDGELLLSGLDLSVPKGGNLLVTGPSGSGKSRLLKILAGLERPHLGRVSVGGKDLWPGDGVLSLSERVSVGFAFATGGLLSNLSLRENIALPLRFRGIPTHDCEQRTESALDQLGLLGVAELRPHAVSPTARKHGNLARVLALDPDVILLDDVLEGLDTADRSTALALIHTWAASPEKTVVIAQEEPGDCAGPAMNQLTLPVCIPPLETP